MGAPTRIDGLRLWVDQDPPGSTFHRILGGLTSPPTEVLAELRGETAWGDVLEVAGDWTVRYLRVETVESPSWVAWLDIKVLLAPPD